MRTGSEATRLIVLRGNSASGKSSVAQQVRSRHERGVAVVGQDTLRRVVLKEKDVPGGANIGLIDTVARYALDHGYHVVVEGILYADHYAPMLRGLGEGHRGASHFYYLDVPFTETLRRHATRPQVAEFGESQMRAWYRPLDLLPGVDEHVVPHTSTLTQTTDLVLTRAGLARAR